MALRPEQAGKESLLPDALRRVLGSFPGLIVAYSGGLDSRFLIHAALLSGLRVFAIHASGPHIAEGESRLARFWAGEAGVEYAEIRFDPLDLPEVAVNGPNRCYECKRALLARLFHSAGDRDWPVCDGGNVDDLAEYRPGARAVAEAAVLSPLAMAGMGKSEIRRVAALTGMERPEQKARPCLLTRYAYGLSPRAAELRALARAEAAIERLFPEADFRLRLASSPILQIDRDPGARAESLRAILAANGFAGAEIAVAEKVGGFYDRARRPVLDIEGEGI